MLTVLATLVLLVVPFALFFWQHQQATVPSLRWPKVAPALGLSFADKPPRMSGEWHGRPVSVDIQGNGARISCGLLRPSKLRFEIGPKDLVTRRAGVVVPDPVPTGDIAFDERFLVRCSDKGVGTKMMDPVLRGRFSEQKHVDVIGQGGAVQWIVPDANDPDQLEERLKLMSEIAAELENHPA